MPRLRSRLLLLTHSWDSQSSCRQTDKRRSFSSLVLVPSSPPAACCRTDSPGWGQHGIGRVWRHLLGQHVRPGLLGERDPEAHHQPAGRRRGVLRDPDRVVGQEHFIPAQELLGPGSTVQETGGVLSWRQERPVKVSPHRRWVRRSGRSADQKIWDTASQSRYVKI